MNCTKCGNFVSEGARFCNKCGNMVQPEPFGASPSNQMNYSNQVNYTNYTAPSTPFPTAAPVPPMAPAVPGSPKARVMDVMKSPLYLIMGISWLVALFFSLISFITVLSDVYLPDDEMLVLVFAYILMATPQLLIGLGFTISASKAKQNMFGGIGAAKAGFIFMIVFVSLGILAMFIASIVSIAEVNEYSRYYRTSSAIGEIILSMMLVIGILVLCLVFFVKLTSSMTSVQGMVMYNTERPISMFAVVMCFIFGGLSLIGTFGTMNVNIGGAGVLVVLNALISVASYIMLGVVLIQLRTPKPVPAPGNMYTGTPYSM